jgi:thiamine-phosphate pyrophosphorylase
MPLKFQSLQTPLIYLITNGKTNASTTPATEDFSNVLRLIEAAVSAKIDLLQIREKQLSTRVLYELSTSAAGITSGSATKLLINDRADVAAAVGADGVHLTRSSLPPNIIRLNFGPEFLIGVSTHSLAEAAAARRAGGDFVVFGPVFDTPSKQQYGEKVGLRELRKVTSALKSFPVLALGGVTDENMADCLNAGAAGIAAIRMLNDRFQLTHVVNKLRSGGNC